MIASSLPNIISESVIDSLKLYINTISVKYDISKQELYDLAGIIDDVASPSQSVQSLVSENHTLVQPEPVTEPVQPHINSVVNVQTVPTPQSSRDNTNALNKCAYVFVRGPLKGTTCGCIVKNPTRSFCPKHFKKGTSPNNVIAKPRKTPVVPDATQGQTVTKVIRRNKNINKFWHEQTGMVFKSAHERVVVETYKDGVINDLTDEDIKICEELGFAYKKPEKKVQEDSPLIQVNDSSVLTDPGDNKSKDDFDDKVCEIEKMLNNLSTNDDNELDMTDDSDEEILEEEEED